MEKTPANTRFGSLQLAIIGLIVAPAILPLIALLTSQSGLDTVVIVAFAGFGYAVALFAGMPIFFVLSKFGYHQWWHYLIVGGVLGYLPALLFYPSYPPSNWPKTAVVFSLYGMVSALIFWFIMRFGRGHN